MSDRTKLRVKLRIWFGFTMTLVSWSRRHEQAGDFKEWWFFPRFTIHAALWLNAAVEPNVHHLNLQQGIAEANEGITHAEFAAGAQNGTIGFKCIVGEPQQFITGARKAIFNIFVLLYTLAPLILIPIWAYHERNAWLLVGIPVSYLASYSAAAHSKLIFLFLMLCIGVWLKTGFSFHQYITFFFFCSACGYLFFELAESTQNEYALQSLIEHPDIFNRAIAEHGIMIVRKEQPAQTA